MSEPCDGHDDDACPKCGIVYRISDWPWCPHGPVRYGVVRDEIPGGFVQEHFGHQPETFYSWSAMRKRAAELHLEPFVRRLETVNEGAMIDAQTLANAAELVSRGRKDPRPDEAAVTTYKGEIRPLKAVS